MLVFRTWILGRVHREQVGGATTEAAKRRRPAKEALPQLQLHVIHELCRLVRIVVSREQKSVLKI